MNHTGILGQYGPTRSQMDQLMMKQFGHPKDYNHGNDYQGSKIGVLGQDQPIRSVMDKKLQQEFGRHVNHRENYTYDVNYRSTMDKMMNKEFNPYYKEGYEHTIMSNPYNPALSRAKFVPL